MGFQREVLGAKFIYMSFEDIHKENQVIFLKIAEYVHKFIDDPNLRVYARGSRVGENYRPDSDYDITVISDKWKGVHFAPDLCTYLRYELGVKVDARIMKTWMSTFPQIPYTKHDNDSK